MRSVRSLDFLRLEMETLWGPDAYGRPPTPHPLVAIAVAEDGATVRFSPSLPDDLKPPLTEEDLLHGTPPAGLQKCRDRFSALGALRDGGGPSYVFDGELPAQPSSLRIVTSEGGGDSLLAEIRPEVWGDPAEWADLLEGRIGPWAIGVADGRVTCVCFTPVASSTAAEAGIWTHPDARRQGWAAATTAAWAKVAGRRFETLFYSTRFDNVASQGVARKLRLRPIGAVWQLLPPS